MTDVWEVYGELAGRDPAELTAEQRSIVAVCDLRQEVNSGGFDVYFRAWGGNSALDALTGLRTLLGADWSTLLATAMALLGPKYPTDPDERGEVLDHLNPDALDDLDRRFYELEATTDADARLSAYLEANPI